MKSVDQNFDAGRLEHIGAELDEPADTGRIACGAEAFGQREGQVHPGGAGVDRQLGDIKVTQREPGGARVAGVRGQVLPGQYDLYQWVVRQ